MNMSSNYTAFDR